MEAVFFLFRAFITKFLIFRRPAIFSKIAKNFGWEAAFSEKNSEFQGAIFRKVFGKPLKNFSEIRIM